MNRKYYMVRVRRDVDAFAERSLVAVGWSGVNFSEGRQNVEALLQRVEEVHYQGGVSPRLVGRKKAEIRRFLEIQKGDILVVPCYKGFYLAVSTGEYIYDSAEMQRDMANQLRVSFLKDDAGKPLFFSRSGKNTALVSKLGVPGFTVLTYGDPEVTAKIDALLQDGKDTSDAAQVAAREGRAMEEIKKTLAAVLQDYKKQSLDHGGEGFERLVADLFAASGFAVQKLSKQCGDGKADADVLAIRDCALGDEFKTAYFVQVKHHTGLTDSTGLNQIVQFKEMIEKAGVYEFRGGKSGGGITLAKDNIRYVFLTSAQFDPDIQPLADDRGIILIDGNRLAEMLWEKIDQLEDLRHQLGFIKKYEHIG